MKWNKVFSIVITVMFTMFLIVSAMVLIFDKNSEFYDVPRLRELDVSSSFMITDKMSAEQRETVKTEIKKQYGEANLEMVYCDTYKITKSYNKDVFVYGADSFVFNKFLAKHLKDININEAETETFPVCVLDDGKFKVGDDYNFSIDGKEYRGYVSGFIKSGLYFPFLSDTNNAQIITMTQNPIIVPIDVLFDNKEELNFTFYGINYEQFEENPFYFDKFYEKINVNCKFAYNYIGNDISFFYTVDSFNSGFNSTVLLFLLSVVCIMYIVFSIISEWKKPLKNLLVKYSVSTAMLIIAYIVMQIIVSTSQFFTQKAICVAVFGTLIGVNLGMCLVQLLVLTLSVKKGNALQRRFEDASKI